MLKRQKVFETADNRRLIKRKWFIYPMGIKSTQSVNESHFLCFATINATIYDRWTKYNKISNGGIRKIKMPRDSLERSFLRMSQK